ncbi:MAG: aquaporin [Buchnera aphidicola (Nurudea ibofushi)]
MKNLRKKYMLLVECISEFLGTGLITFINTSYTASFQLTDEFVDSWKISIILGVSTCIAIYISLIVSEAHLNPIVTLSFFLFFNFNYKKVVPYITFQILGVFFSSVTVYELYYNLLKNFESQNRILRGSLESLRSASIFSFFPNKDISVIQIFSIEFIISFIFMSIIIFLNNNKSLFFFKITFSPILIGVIVCIINIIVSPLTSFTLNPANDIGSRIFAYLFGWGKIAFTGGLNIYYFIAPILGTMFGSVTSVYFYKYIKNIL